MRILELNKNNVDSMNLINNSNKRMYLESVIKDNSEIDNNSIFSCIVLVEDNEIKNYSIYTGVKDMKLVQISIFDLSNKSFLKKSVDYAFINLDAYTVTIFTDKHNKNLEDEGFENLGRDNNMFTYIKEREINKELGRLRI